MWKESRWLYHRLVYVFLVAVSHWIFFFWVGIPCKMKLIHLRVTIQVEFGSDWAGYLIYNLNLVFAWAGYLIRMWKHVWVILGKKCILLLKDGAVESNFVENSQRDQKISPMPFLTCGPAYYNKNCRVSNWVVSRMQINLEDFYH